MLGLLGIDIPLSDLMAVFGEVAFEQLSFKWRKRIEDGLTINYEKDAANLDAPLRAQVQLADSGRNTVYSF